MKKQETNFNQYDEMFENVRYTFRMINEFGLTAELIVPIFNIAGDVTGKVTDVTIEKGFVTGSAKYLPDGDVTFTVELADNPVISDFIYSDTPIFEGSIKNEKLKINVNSIPKKNLDALIKKTKYYSNTILGGMSDQLINTTFDEIIEKDKELGVILDKVNSHYERLRESSDMKLHDEERWNKVLLLSFKLASIKQYSSDLEEVTELIESADSYNYLSDVMHTATGSSNGSPIDINYLKQVLMELKK